MSNVSRGAGSSSLATLSYITGRKVRDERLGETWYGFAKSRRERVHHVATLLPDGAPAGYADPETLFNAVEAADRTRNARTAKKIVVAFPREFDPATQLEVVREFVLLNLTDKGYAATVALHETDGANPHAHILVANRRIDPDTGKWAAKRKTAYALDEHGRRVPLIDPDTGLQKLGKRNERLWKRVAVETNPLDTKAMLDRLRTEWQTACNLRLPKEARIDHRSNEARDIEAVPTIHEGYAARAIEQRGGVSLRCAINRRIRTLNERLRVGISRIRDIGKAIRNLLNDPHRPQPATVPMPRELADLLKADTTPPPATVPMPEESETRPAKEEPMPREALDGRARKQKTEPRAGTNDDGTEDEPKPGEPRGDKPAPMKSTSDLLNRLDATLNEKTAERENTAKKRGRKRRARR